MSQSEGKIVQIHTKLKQTKKTQTQTTIHQTKNSKPIRSLLFHFAHATQYNASTQSQLLRVFHLCRVVKINIDSIDSSKQTCQEQLPNYILPRSQPSNQSFPIVRNWGRKKKKHEDKSEQQAFAYASTLRLNAVAALLYHNKRSYARPRLFKTIA